MLLHFAIRLLLEIDSCKEESVYADKLLRLFIKDFSKNAVFLVGNQFVMFTLYKVKKYFQKGCKREDDSAGILSK